MTKNSNRKGLALGAALSLVASLFASAPVANAAIGAEMAIVPTAGTVYTGLITEEFSLETYYVGAAARDASNYNRLTYEITKTAGSLDLLISTSAEATAAGTSGTGAAVPVTMNSGSTSRVISASAVTSLIPTGGEKNSITFRASSASGISTASPALTFTVKAFIDSSAPFGVANAGEWSISQTVTLIPLSAVGVALTMVDLIEGADRATVSATITGVNLQQLDGRFYLTATENSAGAFEAENSTSLSGTIVAARGGVVSSSFVLTNTATLSTSNSVSAVLNYTTVSNTTAYASANPAQLGATVTKVTTARGITDLKIAPQASTHVTASALTSGADAAVRPNNSIVVRAHAATNSKSVSGIAVSFALSGEALSATKMISVNGGAFTSSYPTAVAATTGADGYASITVETRGFADEDNVLVTATARALTATVDLIATTPVYFIDNVDNLYFTTPGTGVNIAYEVVDQWQVKSSRNDQIIRVERKGTGFDYGTATFSELAVVAGAASFNFLPSPAAKTGSAVVSATLLQYNADEKRNAAGGTADVDITVNVSSVANAFSVSMTPATVSAGISYAAAEGKYSWSGVITGTVKNAGSAVTVASSGLVFEDQSGTKPTASATITVRADSNGQFTLKAAGTRAGIHTVSYTVGGDSTTSQVIIDDAASDAGKTVSLDTSAIGSGTTKLITGKLVDAYGNAVEAASISVTYVPTGAAGIAIGTMPAATDEDGEFSFTVFTGASDNGTAVVSVVYLVDGPTTPAKDRVTTAFNITVGATPAADQKLTVGSFKGFVAIYALNYTGSKLSAKVAGKWTVVEELTRFQRVVRNTGAGYTIKVDLYIDAAFVRSETIVTK